ncbi:14282_t:CDS:2 [Entrophospora sp. SA101]|nr:8159_t:CDS:2 [Entrophospora sp. SA101]CAJ0642939.1 4245_t:CDS:2 [Entrophospora sp. SA101]CAJ0755511.1 14282_t:CDS:2 [Entrophospora sp. SA101]CAJ0898369.1 2006_t:CDS:2 [Entrophospora sp. SA101]CAJ0903143.1 10454_t:CDS:2 [Entrophospora sp. SA101]
MKNNFVVVILLFLAITGLGFSAPQKKATISDITPDEIARFAKLAQAQGLVTLIADLSTSCQSALLSIVSSPEFLQCIPITPLLPLLTFFTDPGEIASLISDPKTGLQKLQPALIELSNEFCVAPKCSDKGVADAIKTIQTGCNPDDMKNPLLEFIFPAAVFYYPARDTICFKDAVNPSHFCLFDDDITTSINLPQSPFKLGGGDFIDSIVVADPTAICTTCNKAIYNTIDNFINSNDLAKKILAGDQVLLYQVRVFFAIKCGIGFEDGKVPDPSQPPPKR